MTETVHIVSKKGGVAQFAYESHEMALCHKETRARSERWEVTSLEVIDSND